MFTLLLVRPGATEFDQQGRIQGTLDMPLSDDGRRQAAEAAPGVAAQRPAAVYASPCRSAQETAQMIAAQLGQKHKTLDKLKNLDHGLWQGMLVEEVRTKQPKVYRQWQEQPQTICPPGGETIQTARLRVNEALKKLQKKHKEGVIALVAPEPLASVIAAELRQGVVSGLWKASERCGAWEAIPADPAPVAGVA
ncbi:histidine phosphatase family protein [Botrimarina sp.]|uniref:histidine phosphatase family protein n=1 Tax=Botrimarina sp. TaxID=2795802 RepID=UPI0032EAC8E0